MKKATDDEIPDPTGFSPEDLFDRTVLARKVVAWKPAFSLHRGNGKRAVQSNPKKRPPSGRVTL